MPFQSGSQRFKELVREEDRVEAKEKWPRRVPLKRAKGELVSGRVKSVESCAPAPAVGQYFDYKESLRSWEIKSFNKLFGGVGRCK